MDTKEIMALMDHFDTSHAVCLKIREGNLAVTLKKAEAYPKAGPQTPGPAALFTAPASPQPEPDSPPEEPGADPALCYCGTNRSPGGNHRPAGSDENDE